MKNHKRFENTYRSLRTNVGIGSKKFGRVTIEMGAASHTYHFILRCETVVGDYHTRQYAVFQLSEQPWVTWRIELKSVYAPSGPQMSLKEVVEAFLEWLSNDIYAAWHGPHDQEEETFLGQPGLPEYWKPTRWRFQR